MTRGVERNEMGSPGWGRPAQAGLDNVPTFGLNRTLS